MFLVFYAQANTLYWVGGAGNWSNPAKWSDTSGGAPGSAIPDEDTHAVFDANSGLANGNNVNIPGGSNAVRDLIVTGFSANFRLRFTGAASDPTELNVHGDLRLLNTHSVVYVGSGDHKWIFHGKDSGSQEINSAGRNLHIVEFPNDDVDYHLNSNLFASDKIEYIGGNLTTNNLNVTTDYFLSMNNDGSSEQSQKDFDLGKGTLNCYEFYAKLVYGTLNVIGDCVIKANKFIGAPSQNSDLTLHHKIILKNYEPDIFSSFDNNFECKDCVIDTLIIDNTFDTRLKVIFTVEDHFEIINSEGKILFNGINELEDHIVTINGDVVTPQSSGCDGRMKFESVFSDIVYFKRNVGVLSFTDVYFEDIVALGSASFELYNSILLGVSSGWTMIDSPTPITYYWIGDSGVNDHWDNPDNWVISGGSGNGCIPTAVDNVIVNNSAINSVRITSGTSAACFDFNWTKTSSDSLIIGDSASTLAELRIGGDLLFDASAIVYASQFYNFILDATTNNTIETNGVELPNLRFIGDNGKWKLKDDLNCEFLTFNSGSLITQNFDVTTNSFSCIGPHTKVLTLGSSHITVDDKLNLLPYEENTLTVNAGNSIIECKDISFRDITLYDLQLNNISSLTLNAFSLDLNTFTLNGTANVTALGDISVNTLMLNEDNVSLLLDPNMSLDVNEEIVSISAGSIPPNIKSSNTNTKSKITKDVGNLCVSGSIGFQDIDVDMTGVFHAPLGVDNGNNTNIIFSNSPVLTPLYWIGNSGDWDVKSNWSNVSGGCPVNKNPNTALKLVFDDYSFVSNSDVITLPLLTNCKTMEFNNSIHPAHFDIHTRLNPLQIFVHDAEVNFSGAKMYVQVKTEVNDGGLLSLDITEGEDPKFDTPTLEINNGGTVDLKSNTLLIIRD